jgi:outer membrane protein TolC
MRRFGRLVALAALIFLWTWHSAGPARAQSQPAAPPTYPMPPGDPLPPIQSDSPPPSRFLPAPPSLPPPPRTLPPEQPPSTNNGGALPAPPLEKTDLPMPITLAAALQLADARPTVVTMAQATAWVAEAQLQRAKILWVPELDFTCTYFRHDGIGPDFNRGVNPPFDPTSTKIPITQNLNYFYAGAGMFLQVPLTDAIYTPLAARQVLNARRWEIQTAKNDALLDTARAYFDVHRYRGMYAGALDTVQRGVKLVERVERLSKDLVPRAEVDRARRALADLQQMAVSARERWRVASADLTEVLRLDPRVVIVPQEHDHLQITLVDPATPLDKLLPLGLTNRPELASQQAFIQAALTRIRQEKLRPLIPTIILAGLQNPGGMKIQAGVFGLGADGNLNLWSPRSDVSLQLIWQLDGAGLGNLARIKGARSEQSRAVVELFRIQDMIAEEVTEAQARIQSAAARVTQAERSLREALITYEKNYEGLRQTKRFENILVQAYRPQEAVEALERLQRSYDEYFMTVADYNRQQFEMYHALGYPASDLALAHPPGGATPVDTSRPAYLPQVGVGPPPATR